MTPTAPFFPTRWDGLLRLKIYICTYEANHDRSEAFYTKASLWFRFKKEKIKKGKNTEPVFPP